MSRINQLIAERCPDGVEHTTLGELGQFIRGNGLQKADLIDRGFPAIHYGQIHTSYGTWTDSTKSFTDPGRAAKLRKAAPGDLLIATTSEDDAAVAKATAWLGNGDVALSGDAYIFRHTLDPKYVSYFFQSEQFQVQKRRFITGTKVRRVSGDALAKITIPVPPLEVQREIVGILDQFSELQGQLQRELRLELEARRRQYLHYRDRLLAVDGDVEVRPLGDLAKNLDRQRQPVTKASRVKGEIPYYGASGVVDYVRDYIFDGDYLLVSEDGANLLARSTPIAFSVSGKSWINNHAHVLEFASYAERRFVEFYLNSIDLTPYVSGGAQPKLNQANLNRIPIPDPPLPEKERVVKVLDALDSLASDLATSLSGELSARRHQYQHYRDKLFTFEETSA